MSEDRRESIRRGRWIYGGIAVGLLAWWFLTGNPYALAGGIGMAGWLTWHLLR